MGGKGREREGGEKEERGMKGREKGERGKEGKGGRLRHGFWVDGRLCSSHTNSQQLSKPQPRRTANSRSRRPS